MKIYLPHIHYTVYLKDEFHKEMGNHPSCQRVNLESCILWIPKKHRKPMTVAHEAMHACQFIAEARSIDMIQEQEHMAYIIGYIVSKVMGYEIKSINK
jgi:hypothetical protein